MRGPGSQARVPFCNHAMTLRGGCRGERQKIGREPGITSPASRPRPCRSSASRWRSSAEPSGCAPESDADAERSVASAPPAADGGAPHAAPGQHTGEQRDSERNRRCLRANVHGLSLPGSDGCCDGRCRARGILRALRAERWWSFMVISPLNDYLLTSRTLGTKLITAGPRITM
jgi:hypothetical protein